MPSSPLDSTDGRLSSGVACHHSPWTAHTVRRRRALHAIIALGPAQTVGHRRAWHAIIASRQHTRSNDIGHGMQSSPLDCKHGRTTSGLAFHHRLWEAHTIERCRVWQAIIALGQQTRSNDVRHRMPSSPLGSTHGRTTSDIAFHHRLRAAHTVRRRRACHEITAL